MLMRILLAASSAFAIAAIPANLAAQEALPAAVSASQPAETSEPAPADEMAEMAALAGMMSGAFKAEPLTPEQEARLPQAAAIISRLIPEGAMAEMSQQMFSAMLGPLDGLMPSGAKPVVAERLGVPVYRLDTLSDEQAAEAANLLDPVWKEREARVKGLVPDMLAEVMAIMEPTMRKAMSELYAIRFTTAELTDIDAFFATETGTRYARESFSMTSDPRILATSVEVMPALFVILGGLEERMQASIADLAEPPAFDRLAPADRARVAELTGISVEDIQANFEAQVETDSPSHAD